MVQCQRCGHVNEPTSRFCVGCGNRLQHDGPPPPAEHGGPNAGDRSSSHQSAQPAPSGLSDALPFAETAPPGTGSALPEYPRNPQQASAEPAGGPTNEAPGPPPGDGRVVSEATVLQPEVGVDRPSLANPLSIPPDAPRVLSGFLVTFDSNALGQSWAVHQGTNLVGRLGAMAGATIELPHATVSSRHATIYASAHPGRLVLQDHGSTNGTFVNDAALAAQQQRQLRDGDRVRLGLFNLIVKIV